jgi:hypothetical protein
MQALKGQRCDAQFSIKEQNELMRLGAREYARMINRTKAIYSFLSPANTSHKNAPLMCII